jgi:transcriptional antiterminator
VAALRDKHPDMPATDIAARLKVSDRTVRRYLPKPDDAPQALAA